MPETAGVSVRFRRPRILFRRPRILFRRPRILFRRPRILFRRPRESGGSSRIPDAAAAGGTQEKPTEAPERAMDGPRLGGYWIHTSRFALYPARSRARLLPALRPLSSPRPPSRGPSLTRDAAAAGGERDRPPKLPPGPRLGPGSGSGATVGGARCEVTGPRCVHAVGLGGRGDGRSLATSSPKFGQREAAHA